MDNERHTIDSTSETDATCVSKSDVERVVRSTQDQMKIEIPSIGVGITRTSCSWIVMMLMAENCKSTQEQVIVEAMRQLGITPEDIAEQYHDKMCNECGMSLRMHQYNNGECF